MLVYYNNLDCAPFVEAVGNMLKPFIEDGYDILKTSYSISGVAKIKMFRDCGAFFCLIPEKDKDLHTSFQDVSQVVYQWSLPV